MLLFWLLLHQKPLQNLMALNDILSLSGLETGSFALNWGPSFYCSYMTSEARVIWRLYSYFVPLLIWTEPEGRSGNSRQPPDMTSLDTHRLSPRVDGLSTRSQLHTHTSSQARLLRDPSERFKTSQDPTLETIQHHFSFVKTAIDKIRFRG